MKHPSITFFTEKCENCRFFVRLHQECHKNPPSFQGWPKIGLDDWCGEFQKNAAWEAAVAKFHLHIPVNTPD